MKHIIHMLALTLSVGIGQSAQAQDYTPGMRGISIEDGHKARPLNGLIWYPAKAGSRLKKTHRNGVWTGVEIAMKAKPAQGVFPLVILSHGMYGNARNQNWLAVELAKQGYITLSLEHPGTSTWKRDPEDARQIWERPKDVSRAISFVLENEATKDRIDPSRIFMAGHSLGGMTAIQLAGATSEPTRVDTICDDDPSALICDITELWQLGKTPEDRTAMSQDLSDARIKAFAIFDLGGTQSLSPTSFNAITKPLLVIGAPKDVPGSLDLDRESRALVAELPKANTTYLEPATLAHFDFLGVCTDKAIPILESEMPGDGMICIDGTDERIADHSIVTNAVLDFFARH